MSEFVCDYSNKDVNELVIPESVDILKVILNCVRNGSYTRELNPCQYFQHLEEALKTKKNIKFVKISTHESRVEMVQQFMEQFDEFKLLKPICLDYFELYYIKGGVENIDAYIRRVISQYLYIEFVKVEIGSGLALSYCELDVYSKRLFVVAIDYILSIVKDASHVPTIEKFTEIVVANPPPLENVADKNQHHVVLMGIALVLLKHTFILVQKIRDECLRARLEPTNTNKKKLRD